MMTQKAGIKPDDSARATVAKTPGPGLAANISIAMNRLNIEINSMIQPPYQNPTLSITGWEMLQSKATQRFPVRVHAVVLFIFLDGSLGRF